MIMPQPRLEYGRFLRFLIVRGSFSAIFQDTIARLILPADCCFIVFQLCDEPI
jgi:hypothetical protein